MQQLPNSTTYDYRGTTCIAPALVLEKNDRVQAGGSGREVRDDLTEALGLIFNEVIERSGGIASRTRPTVTNSLDDTTRAGQYRVFSGVDVSGSSLYWKGLLERQTLACNDGGTTVEAASSSNSLHDEIDDQVERQASGQFRDNRRIFTSISRVDTSTGGLIKDPTNRLIFSPYPLETATATEDDFGDPRFASTNRSKARVRIPFELGAMTNAGTFAAGDDDEDKSAKLLGVRLLDGARETVDTVRARIPEKRDRVLGAILNSNPVAVGPPALDLPIASYRAYRQKYGERATMLYVATLDGLLHAVHAGPNTAAGDRGIRRRTFTGVDTTAASAVADASGAPPQREAWAYAPEMLRRQYYVNLGRQPNLLDGTPVVAEVRLCHQDPSLNQNEQACGAATAASGAGGSVVPPAEQWRSVLVQGAGQSGSGYFALDVTQSGGLIDGTVGSMPDPIPLWEFDFDWERLQLAAMRENSTEARYAYDTAVENPAPPIPTGGASDCASLPTTGPFRVNDLEELPYLGMSVGEPAIGTVALDGVAAGRRVQRPVAVFSAGLSGALPSPSARGRIPNDCLSEARRGRALYIVDLQTGSMLRRFVDYYDPKLSKSYRFQGELVGTPVLHDGRAGVVASRGYVGDAAGRLFRIDLSDTDPINWRMELMYDPCEDTQLKSGAGIDDADCELLTTNELRTARRPFGPASFRPKVALDRDRSVVVVYGLGERGDSSTAGQVQAMIALRETPEDAATEPRARQIVWRTAFPEDSSQPLREKLTGEPVIFNFGVYFTTYVEEIGAACVPGTTRIWGLQLGGDGSGKPAGAFYFASGAAPTGVTLSPSPVEGLYRYYEPQVAQLIRGASVAFRPDCSVDLTGAFPALAAAAEASQSVPELIVTTGANSAPGSGYDASTPGGDLSAGTSGALNYGVKRLAAPASQLRPLSWAIIGR